MTRFSGSKRVRAHLKFSGSGRVGLNPPTCKHDPFSTPTFNAYDLLTIFFTKFDYY
ncbi:hypothetical protein HanRHA438_Chr13g0582221 [Helianthus annuus]|nr:hypothetical protein HanIR_Chr13g0621891 [Helianthus annuus]KAJ0856768.1 hypothetical protein HanRHA438_Chr13g0582221 [Helianthus annuus]